MTAAEQPLIAIGSLNSKNRPDIPDEAEPKEKNVVLAAGKTLALIFIAAMRGPNLTHRK